MPLQRKSLVSFLGLASKNLSIAHQQSTPVTFVVGNESADLDSLCSAVVLAYLRTYAGTDTIHIPLSNLLRRDLSLRPELQPVLSRANVKDSDLLTLSELPSPSQRVSALEPQKTRWILVDHNALQGELGKLYSSQVIGVIDHHDEENQVPKDCGEQPRIVTKSGSCTSLVIQYCREAWDTLSKASTAQRGTWDEELAHLALAPILIDTTNLTDRSKVTVADTEAVKYLESKIASTSASYNRDDYFHEISTAKANIGQLSTPDILRKDYKQWTESSSANLGVSSIVKPLNFLIKKAENIDSTLIDAVRTFAADRKLSLYAVMTTFSSESGNLARELLVVTSDDVGTKGLALFAKNSAETLGLKPWENGKLDGGGDGNGNAAGGQQNSWRSCAWAQEKVENSRKQVGPLLRRALREAVEDPNPGE